MKKTSSSSKIVCHLPSDNKPNAPLSRRKILRQFGLSAAIAPFLPMLEQEVSAQGNVPKRLFLCHYPHGMVRRTWLPSGTRNNFTLNPDMHSALRPVKDRLIIFNNIDMRRNKDLGHRSGMAGLWTGANTTPEGEGRLATGPSIDQVLASRLKPQTRFSSLQFGVRTRDRIGAAAITIYKGSEQPVLPERNPIRMFERIFGGNGQSLEELRLRSLRGSVLDNVFKDLEGLKSKIAATDRIKIEAHLDAVRAIELRNVESNTDGCTGIQRPEDINDSSADTVDMVSRLMIEQIIASAQCDVTRFFSLQYMQSLSNISVRHVKDKDGNPILQGSHDISHGTDGEPELQDKYFRVARWFMQEIGHLLKRLDETPEGNGSMLDNSLVLIGSEIQDGPSHLDRRMPYIMAGGLGGKIQTNQFIDHKRDIHQRLLTTVMHAFGQTESERFGDLDNIASKGVIPGILK